MGFALREETTRALHVAQNDGFVLWFFKELTDSICIRLLYQLLVAVDRSLD